MTSASPAATPLPASVARLTDPQFRALQTFLHEAYGIHIRDEKRPLAESRLGSLARRLGLPTAGEVVERVLQGGDTDLLSDLVDAISTNHTFFAREAAHFDHFRDHALPTLLPSRRSRGRDLRVWCAAASTGEEPYYLAMLIREVLGQEYPQWSKSLLATDVSARVLERARAGIYARDKVAKLPPKIRERYFEPHGDELRVRQDLRSQVVFRRLNLVRPTYPFRQPFDVVFCRNVMIYFDKPTIDGVLARIAANLAPDGYLYVGLAESLTRDNRHFTAVTTGVYQKRTAPAARPHHTRGED